VCVCEFTHIFLCSNYERMCTYAHDETEREERWVEEGGSGVCERESVCVCVCLRAHTNKSSMPYIHGLPCVRLFTSFLLLLLSVFSTVV